jgi:FkbM family methyltransferase
MNVWGAQIQPPNLNRAVAAWLLNAGLMGRDERLFFERTIRPGQVVVDVGANQGIFTLLFSRLVGPEGTVVALEPATPLFEALDTNCRINDAINVHRLCAAAGEARMRGALHCSRFNSGDNRLRQAFDGSTGRTEHVQIVTLDDVLPTEHVSFVKIDVQGYELNVANGMRRIVERSPALKVLFEFWPAGLRKMGTAPMALVDFFVDRGFALFELTGAVSRRLRREELPPSTKIGGSWWRKLLAARE